MAVDSDVTKKVCMCSFFSIFFILGFVLLKPTGTIKIVFLKLFIIILIGYTIYLNQCETNNLHKTTSQSEEYNSQLNSNIIFSYIFSFSLFLLICFLVSFKHRIPY